ncbi:MAG: hypothetical protein IKW89_13655 [Bacteroidales bacterium]|nr:hypothetical protein [Bacteroidales bacterium]
MRLFLKRLLLFLLIPVLLLAAVYLVTDPYKTLRPFSLAYFDATNRDYLSSELFLMNYPEQKYDSYIFASSRGCGINTYHWAKYLPDGSRQFLFQAWSESLVGIDQKVSYIDERDYPLNNALILLDIPDVFDKKQVQTDALSIKDPRISHQSRWIHQSILFYDFAQKPSQWLRAVQRWVSPSPTIVSFDPVTNDWDKENHNKDLTIPPVKDSLCQMSPLTRSVFLKEISEAPDSSWMSPPLITKEHFITLKHIKDVFEKRSTDYKVVIAPGYYQTSPAISSKDLECLRSIFGEDKVFDFSGKNDLTADYNNFSDPGHFGLYVGWYMIEDIYGGGV